MYLVPMLIWLQMAGCTASAPSGGPDAVVPILVTLMNDPSPDTRRTAALSLGKIAFPVPEAAVVLIQALRDPDPLVRQHSAWALGNLGEHAPEETAIALVPLLWDASTSVAMVAAEAIGKTAAGPIGRIGGSERITELVADALRDPHVNTRRAAVKALAWLEAPSSYSVLVQALNDSDATVRQGGIAALGELGNARAVDLLQERLRHDSAVGVRSEAAYRLGKLGDQTVAPTLRTVATGDTESAVKRWAEWAIEQTEPLGEPGSRTSPDQSHCLGLSAECR